MELMTAHVEKAKAAFAAGDFESSVSWFSEAITEGCASRHVLLCNRSAALIKLSRLAEALADANEALQECPCSVKAHYRRAQALAAMNQHKLAAEACADALKLEPGNLQLEALRSSCALKLQDARQKSNSSASSFIDVVRDSASHSDVESCVPARGAFAASEPAAGALALGARHKDADVMKVAGQVVDVPGEGSYLDLCRSTAFKLMEEGEFGQACAWFGHALDAGSHEGISTEAFAGLLANRATALLHLRRYAEAARDCERAVEMHPRLVSAHVRGAIALLHLGELGTLIHQLANWPSLTELQKLAFLMWPMGASPGLRPRAPLDVRFAISIEECSLASMDSTKATYAPPPRVRVPRQSLFRYLPSLTSQALHPHPNPHRPPPHHSLIRRLHTRTLIARAHDRGAAVCGGGSRCEHSAADCAGRVTLAAARDLHTRAQGEISPTSKRAS